MKGTTRLLRGQNARGNRPKMPPFAMGAGALRKKPQGLSSDIFPISKTVWT